MVTSGTVVLYLRVPAAMHAEVSEFAERFGLSLTMAGRVLLARGLGAEVTPAERLIIARLLGGRP